MLKHLSTSTKGYLITIIVAVVFSSLSVSFFIYRTRTIDNYCFQQLDTSIDPQLWEESRSAFSEENPIIEAQLYYAIAVHRQCVNSQKFFYLF